MVGVCLALAFLFLRGLTYLISCVWVLVWVCVGCVLGVCVCVCWGWVGVVVRWSMLRWVRVKIYLPSSVCYVFRCVGDL